MQVYLAIFWLIFISALLLYFFVELRAARAPQGEDDNAWEAAFVVRPGQPILLPGRTIDNDYWGNQGVFFAEELMEARLSGRLMSFPAKHVVVFARRGISEEIRPYASLLRRYGQGLGIRLIEMDEE